MKRETEKKRERNRERWRYGESDDDTPLLDEHEMKSDNYSGKNPDLSACNRLSFYVMVNVPQQILLVLK